MAFRIENILGKETERNATDEEKRRAQVESRGSRSGESAGGGSILHSTLLNRLQPPYYGGSVSESYPVSDRPSPAFHAYGCDRLCYPQGYCSFYFDNDYQRLYTRSRFYPMYTSLPAIFPLQYSHYSKRKGGQVRFTATQTDVLEKRFLSHKYLSPEDRKALADDLKLSDRQVKTWFQNRRAKWRRSSSSSGSEHSTDEKQQREMLKSLSSK